MRCVPGKMNKLKFLLLEKPVLLFCEQCNDNCCCVRPCSSVLQHEKWQEKGKCHYRSSREQKG